MTHRIKAAILVVVAVLAVAACAPGRQRMGPQVGEAELRPGEIITIDGYRLPVRRTMPEGPPQAVILAVHGFNDYVHAFYHPARYWAARGIATYAYDQRGFGATERRGVWAGGPTMRHDLRTAIELVRAAHPGLPFYVLGESMGGAVVISTLADPYLAPQVDGIILVSPATWSRAILSTPEEAALWFTRTFLPWMEFGGQGLGIVATDNDEVLRQMGQDPLVLKWARADAIEGVVDLMTEAFERAPNLPAPALFLYGDNEQVLSLDSIDALAEELPDGRYTIANYADGYHMLLRDREAEIVWADIAAWIADPAAPLPSGADHRERGQDLPPGTLEAESP